MDSKWKENLPIICVVLLVTFMVGLSEVFHEKEIVFPEITALTVGALLAPKLSWRTSRVRMFFLIAVCAVFGLCMVVFVPLPVWVKVIIGYLFCQVVYLYSGTTFAPMISAAILPILMGTESIIYPFSACGFTLLVILTERVLYPERVKEVYIPTDRPDKKDIQTAMVRLAVVALMAAVCIPMGVKFCLAPPLIVAFTEFSRAENKARQKPVKTVFVITACAAGGVVGRMLICGMLGLPLTLAAVFATVVMIAVLKISGMYLPPAGALAILPMILPMEVLVFYPLQVCAGTAVFMLAARRLFR